LNVLPDANSAVLISSVNIAIAVKKQIRRESGICNKYNN
jgi:hypothetical protein